MCMCRCRLERERERVSVCVRVCVLKSLNEKERQMNFLELDRVGDGKTFGLFKERERERERDGLFNELEDKRDRETGEGGREKCELLKGKNAREIKRVYVC